MEEDSTTTSSNPAESEHDQLPSVEDYKAWSGYRTSYRPDPDGSSLTMSHNTEVQETTKHDPGDELDNELRLVDNIDQHKQLYLVSTQESRKWKIIALVSMFIAALATTTGILVARDDITWMSETTRYTEIETYIIETGISAEDAIKNSKSPQHRAAKWMANKDGARLPIPATPAIANHLTFVERYALAVFYFATGGPSWTNQLNFLSDNHVCTWYTTFNMDDNDLDGDYITLGVHGCKTVDTELIPFTLFLRKWHAGSSFSNEGQG